MRIKRPHARVYEKISTAHTQKASPQAPVEHMKNEIDILISQSS